MALGYMWAHKFRGVSVAFDRSRLSLLRDGVERDRILWDDVASVRHKFGYQILTRRGETFNLPLTVRDDSHSGRMLRRQLGRYVVRDKDRPRRWATWGIPLFLLGLLMFLLSKKPSEVFAEHDFPSPKAWLDLAPGLVGIVCLITGLMFGGLGIGELAAGNKKHPYKLDEVGISRGAKSLRWEEIVRIERQGAEDRELRLMPQTGRTWLIDCGNYSDGRELRDALLSHAPRRATPATLTGSTLTGLAGPLAAIAVVALASCLMAVGILIFGWSPGRGDPRPLGYLMVIFGLLILLPLPLAFYKLEVSSEGVTKTHCRAETIHRVWRPRARRAEDAAGQERPD